MQTTTLDPRTALVAAEREVHEARANLTNARKRMEHARSIGEHDADTLYAHDVEPLAEELSSQYVAWTRTILDLRADGVDVAAIYAGREFLTDSRGLEI